MKTYFVLVFCAICGMANADSLRVMSYNILNGFDYGKDIQRRADFVEFVRSENPDILAMQELCGFTQSSLDSLARSWGHEYSVIIKEGGYPVGITSNRPITIKNKMLDGLWHGMLHVESHGIDFFVVHLSPADFAFRRREAALITEYMDAVLGEQDQYLVLGDFNALSPFDAYLDQQRPDLLNRYRQGDQKSDKYNNLMDSTYDYSVVAHFLGYPLIDVAKDRVLPRDRFSFPTPILIGSYRAIGEIIPTRCRIDYILCSRSMAKSCTRMIIVNQGIVDELSDHFPVLATFSF